MAKITGQDIGSFWSANEVRAIFQEANGFSGGLLSCWDDERVVLKDFRSMDYSLTVLFMDRDTGKDFGICNVYGPHRNKLRKQMWDNLNLIMEIFGHIPILFVWDFNCTRDSS